MQDHIKQLLYGPVAMIKRQKVEYCRFKLFQRHFVSDRVILLILINNHKQNIVNFQILQNSQVN